MIPVEKIREIVSKHEILEKELSSDKVDKKNFARISKEYSDLNEILICAKEFLNFYETEKDLEKIINDIQKGNTLAKEKKSKNMDTETELYFSKDDVKTFLEKRYKSKSGKIYKFPKKKD